MFWSSAPLVVTTDCHAQALARTSQQGPHSVPTAQLHPLLATAPGRAEKMDLELGQLLGLRKEVGSQVGLAGAHLRRPRGWREPETGR